MRLEVIGLRKQFKDCIAVKNLSFAIETGDITGFIGPNGAGKTTTMRMITNIETCTNGQILLDGVSVLEYPELIRDHIGYVPDLLPSNSDVSVHEYLDFFASAYGFKTPIRQKTVKEIEEFTNLVGIKDKTIDTLSKGMKQRVSVARALISDPDFILMDEPAAGLDPRARIELRDLIKFLGEQGKGILISSHILSELSEMCNSIIIIEQGELLKSGKIEDFIGEAKKNNHRIYQIKTVNPPDEEVAKKISVEPMVSNIIIVGNSIEFEFSGTEEQSVELVGRLLSDGLRIVSCGFKQENLESIFMNITKGNVQ